MKNIMIILLILGSLLGQDKIITVTGHVYLGSYEGATDEVIHFIEEGKDYTAGIPKSRISQVILEDGTVVFVQSDIPEQPPVDQPQPTMEVELLPTEEIEKIVTPKTVDDLTDQQKREYNRNKISIEIVGQTTGSLGGYGSGLYGASLNTTSWYQWTAYQGMGTKLTEEDFFRMTGYNTEADKAKERYEKINQSLILGSVLSVGGYIVALIPKTTTKTEHYDYIDDYTYEETTYPMLWPGLIAGAIGTGLVYWAYTEMRNNYAPASTVQQIADDYNNKLITTIIYGSS